jgi:probable HAF family extracellular repeat protein
MRTHSITVVALVAALGSSCTDAAPATGPAHGGPRLATYTVAVGAPTVLPGYLASYDLAYGVNDVGDVVGVSANATGKRAVSWVAGATLTNIDGPGAEAHDINLSGEIVGEMPLGGPPQAALWTPNAAGGYARTDLATQLPSPILSTAWAVNDFGQVAGTFRVGSGASGFTDRCFLWTPMVAHGTSGFMDVLPDLGGGWCVANDINDAGYVTGVSTTAGQVQHAFLWSPNSPNARNGSIADLTPGPESSYGTAINNAGQVAGARYPSPTGPQNAAVWTPNGAGGFAVTDLGTFTGDESFALDINDAGFVVGFARSTLTANSDAFFWQSGTLTPLIGTTSITEPTALTSLGNSSVRVVGMSMDPVTSSRTALRWDLTVAEVKPAATIAQTEQLVRQITAAGVLRGGESKSLLGELDAAARQLSQGKTTPARNLLNAFIREVQGLVASGRLTATQAQPLIDDAVTAIGSM